MSNLLPAASCTYQKKTDQHSHGLQTSTTTRGLGVTTEFLNLRMANLNASNSTRYTSKFELGRGLDCLEKIIDIQLCSATIRKGGPVDRSGLEEVGAKHFECQSAYGMDSVTGPSRFEGFKIQFVVFIPQ